MTGDPSTRHAFDRSSQVGRNQEVQHQGADAIASSNPEPRLAEAEVLKLMGHILDVPDLPARPCAPGVTTRLISPTHVDRRVVL